MQSVHSGCAAGVRVWRSPATAIHVWPSPCRMRLHLPSTCCALEARAHCRRKEEGGVQLGCSKAEAEEDACMWCMQAS